MYNIIFVAKVFLQLKMGSFIEIFLFIFWKMNWQSLFKKWKMCFMVNEKMNYDSSLGDIYYRNN